MDAATLALIKKGIDFAKAGIEYIEHDNQVMLGLTKPQWIGFRGTAIGRGNFDNGWLRITSKKGGSIVRLDADTFRAVLKFWNGPDVIQNNLKDGSLEASLWHDLIFVFAKEIATAWGCSDLDVMLWANGLFHAAWKNYGKMYPSAKFVKQKARVAYGVVQFSAPWYHRLKKVFGLAVVLLCVCGGCDVCALFETPPDVEVTGSSGAFGNDAVESIQPWVSTNVVEGVR